MAKELTLNTNKVYIGDPCYVLKGKEYDDLEADNDVVSVPGYGVCIHNGYGDKEMSDNEGYVFSFDSGQLAILDANRCDLKVPKDASFFTRLFIDSLLTIDVPSGVAIVSLEKDDDTIVATVKDGQSGDMLYNSCISVDNDYFDDESDEESDDDEDEDSEE